MNEIPNAPKILVVEDESDAANLIKTALEEEGFKVETSFNGPDGLMKLGRNGFSLVTLDIFMPGMDGWSFLEKMRADSRTSGVKTILFSILETKDAFAKALEMGVRLVPKSSGHQGLISAIREAGYVGR